MIDTKKVVLLLDDSTSVLEFASMVLEEGGFEVETAINVAQMVACLEKRKPDILLVDVLMPELCGYDVVPYLRDVRGVTAPIVLFSSLDEAALSHYVQRCGADGYVKKEKDLPGLVAEVQRMIEKARGA